MTSAPYNSARFAAGFECILNRVFRAAIQLVQGPVREAFLELACAGDAGLRERLEAVRH